MTGNSAADAHERTSPTVTNDDPLTSHPHSRTPIICGSRGSGVGFTSSTDQPFWRASSGTADNAIAPVVSAFGLTSGERPGSHHCPIPRFLPAASPWSGARPADSQITGAWDRGGIVAGLEFAAAAIRARAVACQAGAGAVRSSSTLPLSGPGRAPAGPAGRDRAVGLRCAPRGRARRVAW